jgi:hypothetical protein
MIIYSKKKIFSLKISFTLFLVRSMDIKQDIQPWDQLLTMYPGLVEPIRESWNDPLSLRKIYMITPTKTRAEQTADLIRLAQTLYLVKIIKENFFLS